MPEKQTYSENTLTRTKTKRTQRMTQKRRRAHTNPKPVFLACVRYECQEAGISHKPCSQETKVDNQIETLCECLCGHVGERKEGFFLASVASVRISFPALYVLVCPFILFFKNPNIMIKCSIASSFVLVFIFMRALSVGCPWLSSTNLPLKVLLLPFASVGHPPCEKVGGLPPKLGLPGGPPPTQEKAHDEGFALMI